MQKGSQFWSQNGAQIDPKSIIFGITFLIKCLDAFLDDLGSILAPILEVFRFPNLINNEKATYMKNCTAPKREHTFGGSGEALGARKLIKKRLRKRSACWKRFGMDFGTILEANWGPKSGQNRCQNWMQNRRPFWDGFWGRIPPEGRSGT